MLQTRYFENLKKHNVTQKYTLGNLWKLLTIADRGGRGGKTNADNC